MVESNLDKLVVIPYNFSGGQLSLLLKEQILGGSEA